MPTETEIQDAVQQEQKTSTGPETHQTQAQPESSQQRPLSTPPQTTPSTGTTGSASTTLGGTGMGSGSASATLPNTGGPSPGSSGTQSGSRSGLSQRRSMSPASLLGDPFGMVRSFMDQMDRIFDDFTGLGGLGRSRRPDLPSARSFSGVGQGQGQSMGFWYPQVEVSEKGGNLVVCADLPGLKKEDVRLEIHDDYLVLEGERRNEREENQEGLYRTERSYGQFYRTIPLPEGTNPDQIRANFRDGVLEVTVPMPQPRGTAAGTPDRDPVAPHAAGGSARAAGGGAQESFGRQFGGEERRERGGSRKKPGRAGNFRGEARTREGEPEKSGERGVPEGGSWKKPGGGPYLAGGAPYPKRGGPYPAGGGPYPKRGGRYPTGGGPYPAGGGLYPKGGGPYPIFSGSPRRGEVSPGPRAALPGRIASARPIGDRIPAIPGGTLQ